MNMHDFHISFMENNDIQESAKVLSLAMLNNPLHLIAEWGLVPDLSNVSAKTWMLVLQRLT